MRGWRRTVPRPERSARGGMCGGEEASLVVVEARFGRVVVLRLGSIPTQHHNNKAKKKSSTKPQPIDPPNYVFALSVVAACAKKSRFDRQPIKARLD